MPKSSKPPLKTHRDIESFQEPDVTLCAFDHDRTQLLKNPGALGDRPVAILGGLTIGAHWSDIIIAPESIHQNVNFSGHPIGGLSMDTALFGSVEDICKAQDPNWPPRQDKGEIDHEN